jgi:hypothetical protein
MLDVKSSHILKIIFSHLNEKKPLEIIIYNKKLQDKFEFNLNNYIQQSKIYKIVKMEKVKNI